MEIIQSFVYLNVIVFVRPGVIAYIVMIRTRGLPTRIKKLEIIHQEL